jgi:hypothetical protein
LNYIDKDDIRCWLIPLIIHPLPRAYGLFYSREK